MRKGIRMCFLSFAMLSAPVFTIAQPIDILTQNINIEFESYGACPLYLVPGTEDYDLCQYQQRQYQWRPKYPVRTITHTGPIKSVRYREFQEIDRSSFLPWIGRDPFNIREHYD